MKNFLPSNFIRLMFKSCSFIGIIVNKLEHEEIRKFITARKGEIVQEYTPERRKDDNYYFYIKNIDWNGFDIFIKNFEVASFILSYSDTIRACFDINDKDQCKRIGIEFKDRSKKHSSENWKERITAHAETEKFLSGNIDYYNINWSSIGSCPVETASEFSDGLKLIVKIAEVLNEKCKIPVEQ